MPSLPWTRPWVIDHTQILLRSFRHWLGRPLLVASDDPAAQAEALFLAPFVVVSHNTANPPILNYGNQTALSLWEMDWQTFTQTPSNQTAEPVERAQRAAMLARVTAHGYIDDYSGVRITSGGTRFAIERAIVWNLLDDRGDYYGQAATFAEWRFITTPPT